MALLFNPIVLFVMDVAVAVKLPDENVDTDLIVVINVALVEEVEAEEVQYDVEAVVFLELYEDDTVAVANVAFVALET